MIRTLTIVLLLFTFACDLAGQQTMGLFYNEEDSFNGYTLFSNNEFTYLIDNCGFIVNQWESEYKTNNGLFISPQGDLVRQAKLPGSFNTGGSGGIIERFNWDGDLEWSYEISSDVYNSHHDMELMPNGNILLMVWERFSTSEANQMGRSYPGELLNEQIWEIRPLSNDAAEIVWKWSAIEHSIQEYNSIKDNYGVVASHVELLDLNYNTSEMMVSEDWLHINSINYNPELDQIVFSSRNTSEIYVIDHSTTTNEAKGSTGGKYGKGGDILYRYGNPEAYDSGDFTDRVLHQPHDVSWISGEGYYNDFIIFNNKYIDNTRSRIQIWKNPSPDGLYTFDEMQFFGEDEMIWTFDTLGFYSSRMSSAQFLPDGNILATEGTTGEILEITPEKEIVWRYINPVNKNGGPGIQGGTPQFNSLFKSYRYPTDFEGFTNKYIQPSTPVELLPDDSDCMIHQTVSVVHPLIISINDYVAIQGNRLLWTGPIPSEFDLYIFNTLGKLCFNFKVRSGQTEFDISSLMTGIYILKGEKGLTQAFYRH